MADIINSLGPFRGATSGTAGTSGAVPAPSAGQQTYVLSGAGTWVPAGGGGGGYSSIQNQGTTLPTETILNFVGASAVAADDPSHSRTNVTFAANLNAIAGLAHTTGDVIVGNGTTFVLGNAANIADTYSPVHYTATSATVDGNLAGIDAALGTIQAGAITALTGDVVATGPGSVASTIQPNVVTNAKLAQAPADTLKGNNTGSTANVTDLTGSQATALLSTFVGDSGSGGVKGLVPAPGANTNLSGDFLSASGAWSYVDLSKTRNPDFSLVTQAAVPAGAPGTIKYENTIIFTSIVTGKNYAIGTGFIGTPTLTIWDISDQTSPVIVGTFTAAGGGTYNCTVGVVAGVQYAFVGYNSGSHFVVVNLTNLAAPTQTSSTVITGTAGSIYDVSFLNGYVYCGTQSAGLVVMDVGGGTGSPAVPVQTFTQGSTKSFGVVAIGTNVYTTIYSTSSPYTNRQIVSWTLTGAGTPAVPSLLQSLQITTAGEALGLSVSGNTAFVTSAAPGVNVIDLIDITTPSAMSNLSQISSSNGFNSAFTGVASGNILYIPSGGNATYGGAIDAYDITVRTAPVHIAQVVTNNPNSVFGGIALSGGYIFCADYGVVSTDNGHFDVFTQVDANAIVGTFTSSTAYINSLTPNTALVSSASDQVISSITTATELSYVHGATSNIQAQINAITVGTFAWSVVTVSTALVKSNGYFANSTSVLTFTLPTTAAVGDTFSISSMNTGLFTIAQNAGQSIRIGAVISTAGTGGSVVNTSIGDGLTIICNVVNTGFQVVPGYLGNFNVT